MARESQEEKVLSGEVQEACNSQGNNSTFLMWVRDKMSFFITTEVFDFFSLHLKFILF